MVAPMNPKPLTVPLRAVLVDRNQADRLAHRQALARLDAPAGTLLVDRVQPRLTPLRAKGYRSNPR
jgi:hypothetical protein